jgi:uncharacterized membrane protein SirB2
VNATRAAEHAEVRISTAARRRSRTVRLPQIPMNGLSLALIASVVVTVFVLFGLGGWQYYWSPQDVRAYTDLHPLLRPSGLVGNLLGVAGVSLMVVMHVYTLRKKARWMSRLGSPTIWLEFHIFCGVLGPVLITLHTSFKFNGLISVAYWSMVIVVLSGFVGRYLYVRIPRSIRGIGDSTTCEFGFAADRRSQGTGLREMGHSRQRIRHHVVRVGGRRSRREPALPFAQPPRPPLLGDRGRGRESEPDP